MRFQINSAFFSGLALAIAVVVFPSEAAGQVGVLSDPPNAASGGGAPTTGFFTPGNIESVNAVNGNMSLSIPAAQIPPGPGGFGAGVSLVYNSSIYDLKTEVPPAKPSVLRMSYVPSSHGGGWNYSYKYTLWSQTRVSVFTTATCGAVSATEAANWYKTILATPDGANHPLRLVGGATPAGAAVALNTLTTDASGSYALYDFGGYTNLNCGLNRPRFVGTLIFATSDSSHIRVEANTQTNTWNAFFPDGTQVTGPIAMTSQPHSTDSDATQVIDRNSNVLNIAGNCNIGMACTETLSDAQGRSVVIAYSANAGGGWTDTITAPGPNGNTQTSVDWTNYSPALMPYYCQAPPSGVTDTTFTCWLNQPLMAVSSIKLPAAKSDQVSTIFKFGYGPTGGGTYSWGELHTIESCVGTGAATCQQQWLNEYVYQLDALAGLPNAASSQRPPGATLNPMAKKTLRYTETLIGDTERTEITSYTLPSPQDVYTYPVVALTGSQVTFPDKSYQMIYTSNVCPSNVKLRDLCVAVPHKVMQRDGTITEMKWVSNAPAPGVPAGALFNAYVQYTVVKPLNASSSRVTFTQQDANGNTTSSSNYDWVPDSAITRDFSTGVLTSVCGSGTNCPVGRTTSATFYGSGSYWERTASRVLRAPQTVTSGNAVTNFFYDNAATTANLTQVQRIGAAGANTTSTFATYLSNGNVSSRTDARGTRTLICYDSNNLYPVTQVVGATTSATCPNPQKLAEGRKTTFVFYAVSGTKTSETDADNLITTSMVYDNIGRTTSVQQVGGALSRTTSIIFDDLNRTTTTTVQDSATRILQSITKYDPLGRVRLTMDPEGKTVKKAYRYGRDTADERGAIFELTSNPYTTTSDSTMGWSLKTYQAPTPGSKPEKVTITSFSGSEPPVPFGGNTTSTGFVSTTMNVVTADCPGVGTQTNDGAGNVTTHCSDGLGRLASVKEPDGGVTTYTYDVRDNLTKVNHRGQYRAFAYDSHDRMTKACNPETGVVDCSSAILPAAGLEQYTYDANGNLLTRKDARGITTALAGYDALNRPASRSYTKSDGTAEGTPGVSYAYDQDVRGALSAVTMTIGGLPYSTSYTHDALGRVSASTQTTAGQAYLFGYKYSLTDRLEEITYPSGRVVKYVADSVGRIQNVQNGVSLNSYATMDYMTATGVPTMTMGNGIVETTTWNDRFQLTGLSAGKVAQTSLLSLGYRLCPGGALSCVAGNNGNVYRQTITAPGFNVTQTYTYDSVNRLTGASETGGGPWTEGYKYTNSAGAAMGNRWVDTSTRAGLPALTLETLQAPGSFLDTNRINGWSTDDAGNVQNAGVMARSFTFDAENRQVSATINGVISTYTYDGEGRRVRKSAGGVITTYVYDAFGSLLAEYASQVGESVCGTAVCYVTADGLGSTRLVTDAAGNAAARYDYLPFGTELLAGTGGRTAAMKYFAAPDGFNLKFTGQMRDAETGLDYFNARYYSAAQGRFTSPDPGNAGASLVDPQTWNGYAYVNNSPLRYTDPSGEGIFSWLGGIGGFFIGGPVGSMVGWGAGTAAEAVLWGPSSNMNGSLPSLGSLAGCGGPLGSCGGINQQPWNEDMVGARVQNSERFVFTANPSVKNGERAYWEAGVFLRDFLLGWGTGHRQYPASSTVGRDLARSRGFQQLLGQVKAACSGGQTTGMGGVGTLQAAQNLPYDAIHSPTGVQVGGYNASWASSGNVVNINIRNVAGRNSFIYHIARNVSYDPTNLNIPMRSIVQEFNYSVNNPCVQ